MSILKTGAALLIGAILGGLLVLTLGGTRGGSGPQAAAGGGAQFTCSMHPQVALDHAGVCPICGMDLTRVRPGGSGWEEEDPSVRLVLSEAARKMADVGTAVVDRRKLVKEIRTVGRVEPDEARVVEVATALTGRVEQVSVSTTGAAVRQGEELLRIFSPEVLTTQQQFLFAISQERARPQPEPEPYLGRRTNLSSTSRGRLRLWGMTDPQIDALSRSDKPKDSFAVCAPRDGTVIEKKVRSGQYVREGDILYTLADLGSVWLVLEICESEVVWVRLGQPAQITLESEPNRPASGKIGFIEPVLNDAVRAVRVRVVVENAEGRFRPGMYAQAVLRVPLGPEGGPAPSGASDPELARPAVLAVPAEAVLTTGRRQLVYVEVDPGKYRLVVPKLGPRAGDFYPVVSGLKEGNRVVTRGGYLLDSQFQITGKTSLLSADDAMAAESAPAEAGDGFTAEERAHLEQLPEPERKLAYAQKVCPITGAKLGSMGKPYRTEIKGRTLWLCCEGCEEAVKKDPEVAFKKIEAEQLRGARGPRADPKHEIGNPKSETKPKPKSQMP